MLEENGIKRDIQYWKFCLYGFLKNLRFFDPFIILYFRDIGFSFLQIGILYSIREIAANIFEIPTGFAADIFGRRKTMVLAFAAYIVSFLIFTLMPSFGFCAGAMIMFAFGEACRTGTHKAMILEYLRLTNQESLRVDYYGHTRSWSQRGSALTALIAAVLVLTTGNYRIVFLASIIPYIAGLILMISYPRELDGEISRERDGDNAGREPGTVFAGFAMLKKAGFLRVLLNSSSFDAVFRSVKDYIQPVLAQTALTVPIFLSLAGEQRVAILTGIVYFVLYLFTSAASASAGKVNRHMKNLSGSINITLIAGSLIVFAAGICFSLWRPAAAIVPFILMYAIHNLRRPMTVGYISEIIPNRIMASGLSIESQLRTFLAALGAPLMGYLADRLGVGWALCIMSGLLIALLPVTLLRKPAPQNEEMPQL